MSLLDIKHAKEALAWRLKEWGVDQNVELAAGFIDDLVAKGWRMDAAKELRPQPPKPHEACRTCGRHMDTCTCPDGPITRPLPPGDGSMQANQIRAAVGWRIKEET